MEQLASLIETVKVMPLRPDDLIVLRVSVPISTEQSERVREAFRPLFGEHKILVLDPIVDIEIVRPEAVT